HVLLDALARMDAGRPLLLRVVGDGPEREALRARARVLGLGERVVFEGFVSSAELAERFAGCDAFVLPAVVDAKGDTEGLGVVLLEAMVNAKPVIASAAGGIVDIVRDGRSGWLVPPGDAEALAGAVRACMDDPERRRRYGLAGRDDVAAGFSWPVIVDRLAGLYHEVAARSGGRGRGATAA
ncbi:MAG TPA: glycosyltransferase, partial [Longimicrobiaceae bacterium]|nr:glycosyltransferase [Longimicrobiaceae bacterium]